MTEDIRDADHVARYCSPRKLESDGTPAPGASGPRDRDNGCRSVGWPECFGGSVDDNIPHVRAELRRHYETGESGGLAALNVGMAKRAVRETREVDISVRRDPLDGHRSHACVGGYRANNGDVATTLSEMVGEHDMHSAV